MKELSSTKPSNVKRLALISNYLPFQARVGSPTSSPRLIVLVKHFKVGAISERFLRGNMAATRILREDPGCENPG